MVEIIPYIEDDEDESDWIPLTTNAPVDRSSCTASVGVTIAASPAACTSDEVRSNGADPSTGAAADHDWEQGYRGNLSVTGHEWRRNPSSPPAASASPRDWVETLAARLASASPMATEAGDDDGDCASSGDDEDIVWSRPDGLGGDDDDARGRCGGFAHPSTGDKRDGKTTPAKLASASHASFKATEATLLVTASLRNGAGKQNGKGGARFRCAPEQRHRRGHAQPQRPSPYAATRLQQKLVHDPLRALPLRFVSLLYSETSLRFARAWSACEPALRTLFVIVGLFGACLIGTGITGLGSLAMRTAARAAMTLILWTMKTALATARAVAYTCLCTFSFFAAVFWARQRIIARGGALHRPETESSPPDTLSRVPSLRILLSWAVALSSPSLCEAGVIVLSLRTCMAVIAVPANHGDECLPLEGDMCALDQPASSLEMSAVTPYAVPLLFAATNAIVVMVAANALEHFKNQSVGDEVQAPDAPVDSIEEPATGLAEEVPNDSLPNAFAKRYSQILRQCGTCHSVAVLSLAVLSLSTLCIQALYMHCIGNMIDGIGTIGYNLLCIGSGTGVLVALWKAAAGTAVGANDAAMLKVSVLDIVRISLKKCVAEVSASAVWGPDGIMSDDDGALRWAVLEWAIDRWTTPSPVAEETTAAQPPTADNVPSPAVNHKSDDGAGCDKRLALKHPANPNSPFEHRENVSGGTSPGDHRTVLPSYGSLQRMISKLDADATLIPVIGRYRTWVLSLPPSRNAALYVALWKMCPATAVFGAAALWCFACFAVDTLSWCARRPLVLSSWIANDPGNRGGNTGWMPFLLSTVIFLSPLLFLECQRVRRWLHNLTCQDAEARSGDERACEDAAMALLCADADDPISRSAVHACLFWDTSSLLRRAWNLILESLAVFESSIPAVRCATVACAAADLTGDTLTLLDLALEVKRRGVLGGVWLFVSDAFRYHYEKELERRDVETEDASDEREHGKCVGDGEDRGGKYTGAVVSAVEKLGKVTHNISCLIETKNESDTRPSTDGNDGEDVPIKLEDKGMGEPSKQDGSHSHERQSAEDDVRKSVHSNSSESDQCRRSSANLDQAPTSSGDHVGDNISPEEDGTQEGEGNVLIPAVLGGLAFVGAAAGIAMRAASSSHEQDKRRKGLTTKQS